LKRSRAPAPYRQGVSAAQAVLALRMEQGTQFDTRLLDVFMQWVEKEAVAEKLSATVIPALP